MKQQLLLLFHIICASLAASAQFAPVGTTWNYVDWHPMSWPESHNVKITVEKDTLIQGKIYSKFEANCFKTIDSGRVYYFALNQHHLLFDFHAKIGDTLITERHESPYSDTIYHQAITIDSIYYTQNSQQDSQKVYEARTISQDPTFLGTKFLVYEKILVGGKDYVGSNTVLSEDLLPIIIEARNMSFYCYREPGGVSFLLVDSGLCDVVSTAEMEHIQQQISVYPNPSQGKLVFRNDTPYPIHHLEFYDLSGKQVNHSTLVDFTTFDTSLLPNGNYWVIIELSNHNRILKKITVIN